jgi:hypothetical protein
MGRNHFNATLLEKLLIKAIAIIGFIANKFVRSIASKTAVYSCLDKLLLHGAKRFPHERRQEDQKRLRWP